MRSVVAFPQVVIVIRIELHLKLLVRLHKGVDILHSLLHVDIIVGSTMDDEHGAGEIR